MIPTELLMYGKIRVGERKIFFCFKFNKSWVIPELIEWDVALSTDVIMQSNWRLPIQEMRAGWSP